MGLLLTLHTMKDFIKYTVATLCGLAIAIVLLFFIGTASLVGLLINSSAVVNIKPESVLHITLDGTLTERSTDNPLDDLLGESYKEIGLSSLLNAIKNAKNDANIEGIYIEAKTLIATSPAMLREIREALIGFKESGKFVVAYGDSYSQGCYYICSVADKITLNPKGQVEWCGMAAEPIFYKELLEKIGIKMQVFKVGSYKSAVEPFTDTKMSDANRQQITSYLNNIWGTMLDDVAASRGISREQLNNYADQMTTFWKAEELVKAGMIDTLCYMDWFGKQLNDNGKVTSLVKVKDINTCHPESITANIAVYYAFGDIIDRRTEWDRNAIDIESTCNSLELIRKDSNIKAVVIRINSGGGSAYASEQIWHKIKQLAETKPVVVSMGGMAASGGYYMACAAHHIVAEPTTLTGSIGIFGMIPDGSELLKEKLGLHFDVVKTNRHSDFGSAARPLNPIESTMMQQYIERGYDLFIDRVAEGRKMTSQEVRQLAEGRVWTGLQAVENGLADSNGNLQNAIEIAAQLAQVDTAHIVSLPLPKAWYEDFLTDTKSNYLNEKLQTTLGTFYTPVVYLKRLEYTDMIQARLPYELNLIR